MTARVSLEDLRVNRLINNGSALGKAPFAGILRYRYEFLPLLGMERSHVDGRPSAEGLAPCK
jgi:hypothetical protein